MLVWQELVLEWFGNGRWLLIPFRNYTTSHWLDNFSLFQSNSPVYVSRCRNINYFFGQAQRLMFVGMNFMVKFIAYGHTHSVILIRSSDYSSKVWLVLGAWLYKFKLFLHKYRGGATCQKSRDQFLLFIQYCFLRISNRLDPSTKTRAPNCLK